MSFVVDASVALTWVFVDEITVASEALLDQAAEEGTNVPGIWRLEVANALRSAVRRRRITSEYRSVALAKLSALPILTDLETDARAWGAIIDLSARFDITPYDAAYLELAHRKGLPLATNDIALGNAARQLGVAVAA